MPSSHGHQSPLTDAPMDLSEAAEPSGKFFMRSLSEKPPTTTTHSHTTGFDIASTTIQGPNGGDCDEDDDDDDDLCRSSATISGGFQGEPLDSL